MVVFVIVVGCVFVVFVYLVLRIFKKNVGWNNSDVEIIGLFFLRIIFILDSFGWFKKRLYLLVRDRVVFKDREEKLVRIKKKEKRREIKSLWFLKKKISLFMM